MRAFCTESLTVEHRGLRYTISQPTVQAVHRAVLLYWPEIVSALRLYSEDDPEPIKTLLPLFCKIGRDRLPLVLAGCVSHSGKPGDLELAIQGDEALAKLLIHALTKTCKITAVISTLDFKELQKDDPEGFTADDIPGLIPAQRIALMELALIFHQSPESIMQWGYEAFIQTIEALPQVLDKKKRVPDPRRKRNWFMGGIPGVSVVQSGNGE